MKIQVYRINQDINMPKYNGDHAAGMDLHAAHDLTLKPGEHGLIGSGIKVVIPDGHVGLIWDRSGLSAKHGLKTKGGVIDCDYRGEIKIGIINLSHKTFTVEKNTRIAQMLIQKVERYPIEEIEDISTDTQRGEAGFGASGMN